MKLLHRGLKWLNIINFISILDGLTTSFYDFCPNLILLQIKCVVITLIRLLVHPEYRVLLYLSSLCQDLTCFTPGGYRAVPRPAWPGHL